MEQSNFEIGLENDYQQFFTKKDVAPDGHQYPAVKIHCKRDGVVVVIASVGGYTFVKHNRSSGESLEFVRGYCEKDETPIESAEREAVEELGINPENITNAVDFGTVYADNAYIDQKVHVILLEVQSVQSDQSEYHVQKEERVIKPVWYAREDVNDPNFIKHISDGYTLSALTKLRKSQR